MRLSDLEPFDDVPFYLWVEDEQEAYIWGNKAMAEFAGGDVAGKTDTDLAPPKTAAMMRHHDVETLETGEPRCLHEAIEGAGTSASASGRANSTESPRHSASRFRLRTDRLKAGFGNRCNWGRLR